MALLGSSLGSVDHLSFVYLRFYALQNHGLDLSHNPERLHLSGCRQVDATSRGGQGIRN